MESVHIESTFRPPAVATQVNVSDAVSERSSGIHLAPHSGSAKHNQTESIYKPSSTVWMHIFSLLSLLITKR